VQPQPPEDPKPPEEPGPDEDPDPLFALNTDNCIWAFLLPQEGHLTCSWDRRTSFSNGFWQSLQMYS